ncbi:hypothetical protein V1264_004594 [Littorina saxatilis]|uniref:Receptor ligand binding region domain-containing protein n=2 Tax=Littorina saxatilis TaxID=31220 RepID=A0AAN9B2H7_9CAEN
MMLDTKHRFQRIFEVALLLCCLSLGQTTDDAHDSVIVIPGNVTFAAIFSVNDLEKGACGDYVMESLQSIVAVTWFIEALNRMNYVPGVTIGLEVYRTCKQPHMATEGVAKLFSKYGLTDNVQQENMLFGLLGPGTTSQAIAVSSLVSLLPTNQRVVQISGSATGKQLSNSSLMYSNFFRVIPPDDTQVQVILELLKQLKWNYVAIVYDDDDYGRSAATELRELAESEHLCVPVFARVPLDPRSEAFQDKANIIAEQLYSPDNGLIRGVIILAGQSTTKQLQQIINRRVTYVRLILSEAVNLMRATLLTPGGQVSTITQGALITSPSYIHLPEFVPFWNELWTNRSVFENKTSSLPWLGGYFSQLTGCSHSDPTCWSQRGSLRAGLVVQDGGTLDLYTGYQVKAAAVMAALLKRLHGDKCGVLFGLCQPLRDAVFQRTPVLDLLRQSELDLPDLSSVFNVSAKSTVRFNATTGDISGDGHDPEYIVYNFRKDGQGDFSFLQIGEWMNSQLSINTSKAQFYDESGSPKTWSKFPPAQCDDNHDCLNCERDVGNDVIFMEGDFYVVAIVPVSDRDPQDLLTCGDVKANAGADIAQSVLFAVQRVNNRTGIFQHVLPGKRVGLLVINSCSSQLLVRQRLMQLHAGTLLLPGGRNSASILPRILGYVGAFFSAISMAASETLNAVPRPFVQISAASTSTDLSDTEKYPNFLRLPAPDDKQAQAMLDIVERIGANYIQVIYDSSTAYATGLFNKLTEEVNSSRHRHKVCIAQSIAVKQEGDATKYTRIVSRLRLKGEARIVLVILHLEIVKQVLDNVLPYLDAGEFLFLASESWGRRHEVLQGQDRSRLEGSLVLSQELTPDLAFQDYFLQLDPATSLNPWLRSFWEGKLGCYFSMSFSRKGKSGLCGDLANMEDSVQDPRIPFHIYSVYALTLGASKALSDRCGSQPTRLCDLLTSEDLFSAMLGVELDLLGKGKTSKVFDADGNGLVGYKVLQISQELVYEEVGSWNNNSLDLRGRDLFFPGGSAFKTSCSSLMECAFCSETQDPAQEKEDVPVAAFVSVIVVLVVIIAVVLAVFFLFFRRRQRNKAGRNEATKPTVNDVALPELFRHQNDSADPAHRNAETHNPNRFQQPLPPRPPPDGNHTEPPPQQSPPLNVASPLPSDYLHPVNEHYVDPEQTNPKRMADEESDGYTSYDVPVDV